MSAQIHLTPASIFTQDFLAGRVALVTGGAGGIGCVVAEALAAHGAQVVAADLPSRLGATDTGGGIEHVPLDVTDAAEVRACVAGVLSRHDRLDILVNVAGVVSLGSVKQLAEKEWDRVINTNLKGTFLCCQAVIGTMKQQQFGRIVNFGSVLGKNGGNPRPWMDATEQERAGNIAYGVSKAGVHSMTSYLAKELAAFGITVNAVAPVSVASAMTTSFPKVFRDLIPAGRMGQTDEIVSAVLFLAASGSGFTTGEILEVNGGLWSD
jgi:NAD(P)-dependent dehydrogenase (short-subunit alcohol dehydrogenase family)